MFKVILIRFYELREQQPLYLICFSANFKNVNYFKMSAAK